MRRPTVRRAGQPRREGAREDGFTLVELMMSMAVLSILLAVMSAVLVTGFRTVRTMTGMSEVQTQQQNAAEWLSRLIRFADNPAEAATPIPAVVAASVDAVGQPTMRFYSFSGVGPHDQVPYLVVLAQTAQGITTTICETDLASGTSPPPCATSPAVPATRILVPARNGRTPGLTLDYLTAIPASPDTCAAHGFVVDSTGFWCGISLANGGALNSTQIAALSAVRFTIRDSQSSAALTQTVVMENPR
jgi:prepilin-type N-terminal cleavage/methylation domain-containing protein